MKNRPRCELTNMIASTKVARGLNQSKLIQYLERQKNIAATVKDGAYFKKY
jgi:hypothetical protein